MTEACPVALDFRDKISVTTRNGPEKGDSEALPLRTK
jgi:hypothetical protein